MTHTTCQYEMITVNLIENYSLENTRMAIIIIELFIKTGLGERTTEEHTTVGTKHTHRDRVIDKFLPVLIRHHRKSIISHPINSHLIIPIQPLHISDLIIRLHGYRTLWRRRLHRFHDDIFCLFFLTTTCDK